MRGVIILFWYLALYVSQVKAKRYFIIAPNVFRLNVEETVSVQVWQPTRIRLYLQDEARTKKISPIDGTYQPCFPGQKPKVVKLKITDKDLPSSWENRKIFFYLVGEGPGFKKEAQVLLDIRGGTVFIQTSKPVYRPTDTVQYIVIPVDLDLLPLGQKVIVEITNPNGKRVIKEDIGACIEGFSLRVFQLPSFYVPGIWKITTHFGIKNLLSSSTSFVAREYVLPNFVVRIFPPRYIARTDKESFIKISAKYSFGKYVRGSVRVRISVVGKGTEVGISNEIFPIFGETVLPIKMDRLFASKAITNFPSGRRLKILASVTEKATGTVHTATDSSAHLLDTPFVISLENIAKYYMPEIPFRVKANVFHPNREPAKDVPSLFTMKKGTRSLASSLTKTNENGEAFYIIKVSDNTSIDLMVKTAMPGVQNTESTFSLKPYQSAKGLYISLVAPVVLPKIGSLQKIKVYDNFPYINKDELSYLVVSRGRIVDQGVVSIFGKETYFTLRITADMAPKCRIVAYYQDKGEVAANSILIDVEDGYRNQVSIKSDMKYMKFHVSVQSENDSLIGLFTLDAKTRYLKNENWLTNEKIFKDIGGFDLGCGVGAGRDNREVLHNAGLIAITNTDFENWKKIQLGCPQIATRRKPRSVESSKTSKRSVEEDDWIADSDDLESDETTITVRHKFPEDFIMQGKTSKCKADVKFEFDVPDQMTAWEITALSINKNRGLALSKTLEIPRFKNIFLHIDMPYSVQQRRQIVVYAVVHNYNLRSRRVNVHMISHESICSIARPGQKSARLTAVIRPYSNLAFPFTIIPMKSGKLSIEFVLFSIDSADRVIKDLLVVQSSPSSSKHTSFDESCNYDIEIETREYIASEMSRYRVRKGKERNKKCKKSTKRRKRCEKNRKTKEQIMDPTNLTIEICARHQTSRGSSMVVMDIGLITGFKPDLKELRKLYENLQIKGFEINDRSVVIFLNQISKMKEMCVKLLTKRDFKAGDINAVPVKVYDYDKPAQACTKFYGTKKSSKNLQLFCIDESKCKCSRDGCSKQRTTNPRALKKKACVASNIVFRGTVLRVEDTEKKERVTIEVNEIFKTDKAHLRAGVNLQVYKAKHCAYPDFEKNQQYLIMLKHEVIYVVDGDAFILAWPKEIKKITKLRKALNEVRKDSLCIEAGRKECPKLQPSRSGSIHFDIHFGRLHDYLTYSGTSHYGKRYNYLIGQKIRITCGQGYRRVGPSYIICMPNLQWSAFPMCKLSKCQKPPDPKNGKSIDRQYSHDAYAEYECFPGFQLKAPAQRCNYGVWYNSVPQCVKDYSICGEGGPRGAGQSSRIFGGKRATDKNGTQWPWQIAIYSLEHGSYICGGTLIRKSIIVTAAHCIINRAGNRLQESTNFRIIMGEIKLRFEKTWIDAKSIRVRRVFTTPAYNPTNSLSDDIALMELTKPVEWSSKIRPVCLPSTSQHHQVKVNQWGYVSGFGIHSTAEKISQDLRYVSLQVQLEDSVTCPHWSKDNQFCAGISGDTRDACKGDSGGPFVLKLPKKHSIETFKYYLMGIVSAGPKCGSKKHFGVYTKVESFLEWINKKIAEIERDGE